jgi:dienelactone hydrolase
MSRWRWPLLMQPERTMLRAWCATAILILMTGCAALPSRQDRQKLADELAAPKGWHASVIATDSFDIQSYGPKASRDTLTVYIEGDGFAWVTASTPSDDPTPRDPVALRMALAQPHGTAAYLARPCQYTLAGSATARPCPQRYWTTARFAEPVVQAESQALDELKRRHGASRLVLVGYSGGGAVAALLAARRADVVALITVAGNLDHLAWTSLHGIRPLEASLNPIDQAGRLARLRQWHLVGEQDRVVPADLVRAFVARQDSDAQATVIVEPGFGHACCWAQQWPRLWTSLALPH